MPSETSPQPVPHEIRERAAAHIARLRYQLQRTVDQWLTDFNEAQDLLQAPNEEEIQSDEVAFVGNVLQGDDPVSDAIEAEYIRRMSILTGHIVTGPPEQGGRPDHPIQEVSFAREDMWFEYQWIAHDLAAAQELLASIPVVATMPDIDAEAQLLLVHLLVQQVISKAIENRKHKVIEILRAPADGSKEVPWDVINAVLGYKPGSYLRKMQRTRYANHQTPRKRGRPRKG